MPLPLPEMEMLKQGAGLAVTAAEFLHVFGLTRTASIASQRGLLPLVCVLRLPQSVTISQRMSSR